MNALRGLAGMGGAAEDLVITIEDSGDSKEAKYLRSIFEDIVGGPEILRAAVTGRREELKRRAFNRSLRAVRLADASIGKTVRYRTRAKTISGGKVFATGKIVDAEPVVGTRGQVRFAVKVETAGRVSSVVLDGLPR